MLERTCSQAHTRRSILPDLRRYSAPETQTSATLGERPFTRATPPSTNMTLICHPTR
jgi:hypothetical protein